MTEFLQPRDATDVESAVSWALAQGKRLEIVARGTKRGLRRPAQADLTLDLSELTGVTLYEPAELVLSAAAATPLAQIDALLAAHNQELAFEPMRFGPLLGAGDAGSIGGVIAGNISGPRRIKAGAARDHFLGVKAVSGRGESFKAGGRVVKNVTGYDLCKLLAGSWGTLAVMTSVTLKTLPKAETEATVILTGLDDATAVAAMAAAMGSSCETSAAAHVPAEAAALAFSDVSAGKSITVLRLEGVGPSVVSRTQMLAAVLKPFGVAGSLDDERSRRVWRAIRDVEPFAHDGPFGSHVVWRISTAPSEGARLAEAIARQLRAAFIYDWAGGLVWAALEPSGDGGAAILNTAVESCGGHATLVRAPDHLRMAAEPPTRDGALLKLTRRIKEGFDPKGVLNPGRMWDGL